MVCGVSDNWTSEGCCVVWLSIEPCRHCHLQNSLSHKGQ